MTPIPFAPERMRCGDEEARAERGVLDEMAAELIDGIGLGISLRRADVSQHNLEQT